MLSVILVSAAAALLTHSFILLTQAYLLPASRLRHPTQLLALKPRVKKDTVTPAAPTKYLAEDGELEYWQTAPSNVFPFAVNFSEVVRPQLVTYEVVGTLLDCSQSVGRWYREALNTVCEMSIRLPQPEYFTAAHKKAFERMYVTFSPVQI